MRRLISLLLPVFIIISVSFNKVYAVLSSQPKLIIDKQNGKLIIKKGFPIINNVEYKAKIFISSTAKGKDENDQHIYFVMQPGSEFGIILDSLFPGVGISGILASKVEKEQVGTLLREDASGGELYNAVGMVWEFTKPGITFPVKEIFFRSKTKGATISFEKTRVVMDGFEFSSASFHE